MTTQMINSFHPAEVTTNCNTLYMKAAQTLIMPSFNGFSSHIPKSSDGKADVDMGDTNEAQECHHFIEECDGSGSNYE